MFFFNFFNIHLYILYYIVSVSGFPPKTPKKLIFKTIIQPFYNKNFIFVRDIISFSGISGLYIYITIHHGNCLCWNNYRIFIWPCYEPLA